MVDFDRILASAPVNSSAARQLGRGVEWIPSVQIKDYFLDMPEIWPDDYYREMSKNPEWVDFRGMKFERLTVVGVMVKDGNTPASWVCRCSCGQYCSRKSRNLKVAMRGGNSFVGMCGMCDYQRRLRTGWTPEPKGVLKRG